MLRFIVLGLIPGTDIQISFFMFLQFMGFSIVAYMIYKLIAIETANKTDKQDSEPIDLTLLSI